MTGRRVVQLVAVGALLATASVPQVYADALTDLQIIDGVACKMVGSTQKVVVNNNAHQRIVANIRVDADVASYKYVDKNGVEQTFSYPYQKEVRLLPGATSIIGCTRIPISFQNANQSFTVAGAFYPDPGTVFPLPPENPDDFVGWIYRKLPAGVRCEDGTTSWPLMHLYNRHPSRALLVDVSENYLGDSFDAPIGPQYASSGFGCARYNGQWRGWRIRNVRFSTPALEVPLE